MHQAINPCNGQALTPFPSLSKDQLEDRIATAHNTFTAWRKTEFAQRALLLRKVAKLLREDLERLARYMTVEMGKPIKEARAEVLKSALCAEHYADHGEAYLAPQILSSDAERSYVQHLPLGAILGILPWNAPFWLAFRFCVPAIMAGNTCLMKHDPHVPSCAEAIADVFKKSGAPEGLLEALYIDNPMTESVIADQRVKAVSFTGSSRGGAAVAVIAAAHLKPVVLELGGSDPAIVCADANLDRAADAICLSRIINAGQSCIAAKRIIVESAVHDDFVERLRLRLAALKVGDPQEESTGIGPIARNDLRENLARQVDATVAEGATCLLGGAIPQGDGFFYPVTLLTDVHNAMTACREETFGPVAVVLVASNLEEALAIANDTEYGLAASIWTSNTHRGEALAQDIEAGQFVVNGVVKTDPRLPSGGIKKSGMGRELGPHGILEFVNRQQVWIGSNH